MVATAPWRSLITTTASAERVVSLKERLIRHRVTRGRPLETQTHAFRLRARAHGLRCVLVEDTSHGSRMLSEEPNYTTASAERVGSLKERLIHPWAMRGRPLDAQTHAFRLRARAHGLRCVLVDDTSHGSRMLSEEPNYYYGVG